MVAVTFETPDYSLLIPAPCDWISSNKRLHWRAKAWLTAQWLDAAGWALKAAKLPALGPSRVVAELHMTARRRSRIDPANYTDTAKPCVDACVSIGRIWPDDSADWVEGPDMRLGPVATREALVLHIFGEPCCADAGCHHGRGA
jgi:hypothetical protein